MDDRRILMGLVYPVRFGGFCHTRINHKEVICMKQKTGRKLLSFLLTLAMVLGLVPGMGLTALAWDGDPYAELLNTTTAVNFDGKEWYLIENNSTAANAGTVTLLSKECVAASQYNSSSGKYVEYASSTVKTAVDNYYTNSISSDVKTAIVDNKQLLRQMQ